MHDATAPQRSDLLFAATALLLTTALVFGGGQGTLGDTAVQLLSLAALALLLLRNTPPGFAPSRWSWLPVLAVAIIPLLQLLPVPASLWSTLGGRTDLAAQLATAGVAPDARLGLNPTASERALAWLLPGIAMYLCVLRMSWKQQSRLVLILLCVAAASVVLGLAQLAGGRESALRFYQHTNPGGMVGFFANRNHAATLLALCLPLAMALAARRVARRAEGDPAPLLRIAASVGLLLLLMLGLGMTQSRAGLLVGMFAVLATCPVLLGLQRSHGVRRLLAATGLVAGVLIVQFALLGILQSFGSDPLGDSRRGYVGPTLQAAAAHAPTGSGLGTFRQVYQPFERDSSAGAGNVIVNHAHNDYLELWVETGWLLIPCALLLLAPLAYAAIRQRRHRGGRTPDIDLMQRRAAAIALLVPILHSLFDYPLRTTAHIAVFGLLAGIVVAGAADRAGRQRLDETKNRQ